MSVGCHVGCCCRTLSAGGKYPYTLEDDDAVGECCGMVYSKVVCAVPFGYEMVSPCDKSGVEIVGIGGYLLRGSSGCGAGSKRILQICRVEHAAQSQGGLQHVMLAGSKVEGR